MPVFKNQENKVSVLLPPGDYIYTVVNYESGLQTGNGKTAGSPFWELHLEITDPKKQTASVYERLIDHPSCDFKIDTFLKSAGVQLDPGTSFEFDERIAMESGYQHVDVIGLRGWCALVVDEYDKKGGGTAKRNKVSAFLTNRPKLGRVSPPPPPPAHSPRPAPAAAPTTQVADPLSDDVPF